MSTEIACAEAPAKLPDQVFDIPPDGNGQLDKLIEKIERLETDLTTAKDVRREERFYWIFAADFLFNLILIKYLDNVALFLIMLVPQLFVLVGLARYLGVDWAVEPIERSLKWFSDQVKRPSGKE
ncbi:hypothetical protein EET67_20640 [Pseudaminobacter arsenicus]|uniref:Uncharacterized protein n=1 Tax=Borborobacter arsenicus TaxID=1851146 RepID=A0A432V1A1_9HYPH|nr:hypothetical protein [Pseudaminobacter arsenicus]RUM95931.1 hypothetical protein EET67_20640 [Pseudaminobacter arsenicus]